MSYECFTAVSIRSSDGDENTLSIYLIESLGLNPPETIHYQLEIVTGLVSFVVPDIRLRDAEEIGRAIVSLAEEYKNKLPQGVKNEHRHGQNGMDHVG